MHRLTTVPERKTRASVLRLLAVEVTTKDLLRIEKHFPHILSEAVRELNGEVEYQMCEVKDKRKRD